MTSLLGRAHAAIQRNGIAYVLREVVPHLHKHYVRDYLPRRKRRLNGVTVRSSRLFDDVVPWTVGRPDPENYESEIVSNLRSQVRLGDSVVVVGGGWGVSTVVAAEEAGPDGSVHTYEASPRHAEYTRETTRLNDVDDRCSVENAVVSHAVSTQGETESDDVVSPADLPECDVLELDCEGAELEILRQMTIRPRTVIVETHGAFGSPTEAVVDQLESLSYDPGSPEPADRGLREMCEEQDIYVLAATYEGQ